MNIPTKHCPQCGTSAASAALFCAQCGSQFAPPASEPSSYVCEECDTVLPGGSRFCPGCGMAFDTPVPMSEPQPPSPGFRPQTPRPNPIPVTLHQSQPVPVAVQLKMPSFSHANGPKVNYGWINESWALFQQKPDVWILATLAQYLPFALLYGGALFFGVLLSGGNVLATPDTDPSASEGMRVGLRLGMILAVIPAFFLSCRLNYATCMMANKQVRGEGISFSDVFKGGLGMWPLFWLGIVWNILFIVSAIFFYLPALVFTGLTLPCAALAAEGIGPVSALQRSIAAMKNDWLNATGVVILFLLIMLLSAVPCGLGLLITYPMANLLVSLACRDMIGLPSVSDASFSTTQSFAPLPLAENPAISESQLSTLSRKPALHAIKANKTYIVVAGSVLAAAFLALGFGMIRSAHSQSDMPNTESVRSTSSLETTPANVANSTSLVPGDRTPTSDPPAVEGDDTSRNDGAASPPSQSLDTNDLVPEASDNSKHTEVNADDVMSAYAPPASGLSDLPLSIYTLQNEVVTRDDLKNLSLRALSISHNTIYALHGNVFSRQEIQGYFNAQSWYHPDPRFSESRLSPTEATNAQAIRAAERRQFGYGKKTFDEQGRFYQQDRDPVTEVAAPESGLSDSLLSMDSLQNHIITDEDLSDKSLAALSISYNAIYAAHGYIFKRASLAQAFGRAAWYHPNPAFRESDLTVTERANLQAIRSYERSRFGY